MRRAVLIHKEWSYCFQGVTYEPVSLVATVLLLSGFRFSRRTSFFSVISFFVLIGIWFVVLAEFTPAILSGPAGVVLATCEYGPAWEL
jgi:biotin transporter BioY